MSGQALTRSRIIALMAEDNPHLTVADMERIVAALLGAITEALERGERVEIRGFGVFDSRWREARVARNPRTGEAVMTKGAYVPFFKMGGKLRERLNRRASARGARAR